MNERTEHREFMPMPVTGPDMFSINAGIEKDMALGLADGLDESVHYCLRAAIDGGMPSELAFICEFAMATSMAIRSSLEAVA